MILTLAITALVARADCFDPSKVPQINEVLAPRADYHETPQTIAQIHDLIWAHREELDPRLVYFRIIGESGGDAKAPGIGHAYGLFQFTDKAKRDVKRLLEKPENRHVSPRLIEVRYYLETYLQDYIEAADKGAGCRPGVKWAQMSNEEKLATLGLGKCGQHELSKDRGFCAKGSSSLYATDACPALAEYIFRRRGPPLCDRSHSAAHRAMPSRRSN